MTDETSTRMVIALQSGKLRSGPHVTRRPRLQTGDRIPVVALFAVEEGRRGSGSPSKTDSERL